MPENADYRDSQLHTLNIKLGDGDRAAAEEEVEKVAPAPDTVPTRRKCHAGGGASRPPEWPMKALPTPPVTALEKAIKPAIPPKPKEGTSRAQNVGKIDVKQEGYSTPAPFMSLSRSRITTSANPTRRFPKARAPRWATARKKTRKYFRIMNSDAVRLWLEKFPMVYPADKQPADPDLSGVLPHTRPQRQYHRSRVQARQQLRRLITMRRWT